MENRLHFRKANIDDVDKLMKLRKRQFLDEGASANNNIDDELKQYFSSSIEKGTLVVWIATECDCIISTCGVCFFNIHRTFQIQREE